MQAEYVVRRREEELAETKRSLQCFIDAVKSPNEDKINYSDKSKDGGLFPSKVSPDNNYQSELPAKKHNVAPSLSNLVPPIPNVQSSRDLFDDSRSAMKILLLESQRLRKGLSFADEHISLLQKQVPINLFLWMITKSHCDKFAF